MDSWRLIIDGKCPAEFNMAADAYLLELAEKEPYLPILRIYGWQLPSITIGFHQKIERAVDPNRIGLTPLARRITGGRALYHDSGEITYAVAGNYGYHPELGKTLHDSYIVIARALLGFYRRLGWPAEISVRSDPFGRQPGGEMQKGCFASVSRYEIVAFDRKIAASAQRRTMSVFLQHGAVRFSDLPPHAAINDALIREKQAGLPAITEGRSELEAYFVESFAESLKIGLREIPFDESERQSIQGLTERFKINFNSKF